MKIFRYLFLCLLLPVQVLLAGPCAFLSVTVLNNNGLDSYDVGIVMHHGDVYADFDPKIIAPHSVSEASLVQGYYGPDATIILKNSNNPNKVIEVNVQQNYCAGFSEPEITTNISRGSEQINLTSKKGGPGKVSIIIN